ncbi:MAG: RNA 2',3'-cyclic phosphodiesterase [Alphaproteobacteria bacterium]|nr:RNA 2',3'-cyclic phosphodiesterase [Alphaproteobacteria bacterium]
MIRLFVGLAIPESIVDQLDRLTGSMPGARWVEPENFHITLRFIGEVDEMDAEDLHHELLRVRAPRFSLTLKGVDAFGQGHKTRALWAGVDKSESLNLLRGRVDAAVVRAGQPPEQRKFVPHVTLARFTQAPAEHIQSFIEGYGLFRAGPFEVDYFVLFESEMGNGGSAYTVLQEYPLDPSP